MGLHVVRRAQSSRKSNNGAMLSPGEKDRREHEIECWSDWRDLYLHFWWVVAAKNCIHVRLHT